MAVKRFVVSSKNDTRSKTTNDAPEGVTLADIPEGDQIRLPLGVLESAYSLGEAALGASSGVLVHGALRNSRVDALDCHL